MELKLDVPEVARSLHRAWQHANRALLLPLDDPAVQPPSWDALSIEEQAVFLGVAARGERIIDRLEGQTLPEVAFALFSHATQQSDSDTAQQSWVAIGFLGQTMWEAIARHMAMLVDCDEVADLDQAEAQWYDWAKRKVAKLQADPEACMALAQKSKKRNND